MATIALLLSIIICVLNVSLSIYYFYRVKSIWRWIKLSYAASNGYMLFLLLQSSSGNVPTSSAQFWGLFVLLVSILSGLIVSFAKLNLARHFEDMQNNGTSE